MTVKKSIYQLELKKSSDDTKRTYSCRLCKLTIL